MLSLDIMVNIEIKSNISKWKEKGQDLTFPCMSEGWYFFKLCIITLQHLGYKHERY